MIDTPKDWVVVIIGALVLILFIPFYQKLSLSIILIILFAIYMIIVGILGRSAVVSMIIGFTMLLCGLIWILTQKLLIISFEVILYLIIATVFTITAILTYLGYLPEKWL